MKKLLFVGIGIALTLVVLGAASLVYAQSQTPPTTAPQTGDAYQNFQGFGMMRGRATGMMGAWRQSAQQGFGRGMMRGAQGAQGPMHQYMVTALAGKLNLSVDELQAKIEAGERPYDIAKALGLSDEQIQSLLAEAHAEALQAAVAAGALTQEQADFMSQRMAQMHQNGFGGRGAGFGGCPMSGAQP
jgi:hypothetical protein